jgi:hypothetical protein
MLCNDCATFLLAVRTYSSTYYMCSMNVVRVEVNPETQKVGPVTKFEQGCTEYQLIKQTGTLGSVHLTGYENETESQQIRLEGYM